MNKTYLNKQGELMLYIASLDTTLRFDKVSNAINFCKENGIKFNLSDIANKIIYHGKYQ